MVADTDDLHANRLNTITSNSLLKLSPKETNDYINYCLERGDAPIKPHYLKTVINGHPDDYPPLRQVLSPLNVLENINHNKQEDLNVRDLPEKIATSCIKNPLLCDETHKRPINATCINVSKNVSIDDSGPRNDGGQQSINNKEECIVEPPESKRQTTTATKERRRGQNKNRSINMTQISVYNAQQLCGVVASSTANTCSHDDKCRFIHDRDEFMKNRPSDIGSSCRIWEETNLCRYGLNCRFGTSHIVNNFNVSKDTMQPVTQEMIQELLPRCLNEVSEDLRISLRKHFYKQKIVSPYKENVKKEPSECQPVSLETECQESLLQAQGEEIIAEDDSLKKNIFPKTTTRVVIDDNKDCMATIKKKKNTVFSKNHTILAPLTTVGNLPFRRLCVQFGADVTVSEMALASSILEGKPSELALLKRHPTEKYFGIQLASGHPSSLAECVAFLEAEVQHDFVDLNAACPLEGLHKKLAGSILMTRPTLLQQLATAMRHNATCHPITVKMRSGYTDQRNAHQLISRLENVGVDAFFVHGRTSRQRYTKRADWDYVKRCKESCVDSLLIGNGDVMSWDDYQRCFENYEVDNILIGRGALIKPWIFTELKEKRLWDIAASERLDLFKDFVNFGLEHWGSDNKGVETTRRYFLELCSFTHRYIPVGLLEYTPQAINWRPPFFVGRSDLETLLASPDVRDWIAISEMLLGPVPNNFQFIPKHKSSSYS